MKGLDVKIRTLLVDVKNINLQIKKTQKTCFFTFVKKACKEHT